MARLGIPSQTAGDPRVSRCLFPLQTSVELFDDPTSPAATTRVKQAAVLYEELLIEGGLYEIDLTSAGSFSNWLPPEHLTPERLVESRRVIELGAPVTFTIGEEEAEGVPAPPEAMRTLVDAPLSKRYVAEFYSGVLDELAPFGPDWVRELVVPPKVPTATKLGHAIWRPNSADSFDKNLMRDRDRWRRRFTYQAFNRDAALAGSLDAAFNLTSLFEPMLARGQLEPRTAGETALRVVAPDLGRLPWEAIIEFREHGGSEEARAKLGEFDRRAAESESADALEYFARVSQEVTRALFQAVKELRPKLGEEVAKETAKTGVSLIPFAGPFLEKVATAAELGHETHKWRHSWVAALMELGDRAP